jgi:hypothetical protein
VGGSWEMEDGITTKSKAEIWKAAKSKLEMEKAESRNLFQLS